MNTDEITVIGQGGITKKEKKPQNPRRDMNFDSLKYANIGFYLVTPLLVGVFLGVALDNWLHTSPLFIIVLIVLGSISSFYNLYKLTKDASH